MKRDRRTTHCSAPEDSLISSSRATKIISIDIYGSMTCTDGFLSGMQRTLSRSHQDKVHCHGVESWNEGVCSKRCDRCQWLCLSRSHIASVRSWISSSFLWSSRTRIAHGCRILRPGKNFFALWSGGTHRGYNCLVEVIIRTRCEKGYWRRTRHLFLCVYWNWKSVVGDGKEQDWATGSW